MGADPATIRGFHPDDSLNEAARRSTKGDAQWLATLRAVPEKALYCVWRAIQYPPAYDDVLGGEFDEGQSMFLPAGLRDYVAHTRTFNSAVGEIFRRDDPEGKPVPRPPPIHGRLSRAVPGPGGRWGNTEVWSLPTCRRAPRTRQVAVSKAIRNR